MKIFRPLAAVLFVFALGLAAVAQESSEVAGLRAKAVKGNGIAQYNLGLAYAQGRGIAADQVEAFVWLSLARENGARGRALDTVIGSLDRTGLDLAQQRLTERKAALGVRPAASAPVRAETPAETPVRSGPAGPVGPAPAPSTEDSASSTLRAASTQSGAGCSPARARANSSSEAAAGFQAANCLVCGGPSVETVIVQGSAPSNDSTTALPPAPNSVI